MSIIEINGITVNGLIGFSQSTEIEHDYVVQTLDGSKHSKFKRTRDKLSMTISPKSYADYDIIWNELSKKQDYVSIKYPIDTCTNHYTERNFILYEISRQLLKKYNDNYKYSEIKIEYEEM